MAGVLVAATPSYAFTSAAGAVVDSQNKASFVTWVKCESGEGGKILGAPWDDGNSQWSGLIEVGSSTVFAVHYGSVFVVLTASDIRDGEWHHLAGVADFPGGVVTFYIDGTSVDSDILDSDFSFSALSHVTTIGAGGNNVTHEALFSGKASMLGIFGGIALSSGNVITLQTNEPDAVTGCSFYVLKPGDTSMVDHIGAGSITESGITYDADEPFGGGGNTPVSVGGTITLAGNLDIIVVRTFTGSVSSSGTLTKQAQRTFAASISSSGILTKRTERTFTASITSAGQLLKTVSRTLIGVITPSGVLSALRTILLSLSGSITSSGTLRRDVSKPLSGSLTSSGTLTQLIARTFSGSISSTGSVIKSVARTFSGSVTSSGAVSVLRTVLIFISGTITSVGNLTKDVSLTLTGSVTSSGVVTKIISRVFTGLIQPTGTVFKNILRLFVGVINLVGSLVTLGGAVTIDTRPKGFLRRLDPMRRLVSRDPKRTIKRV